MSYVFRSSGYIRDRSVYCRCIVSFACRYTVNVHVNVNVVSLYLSCYTSYIVRDFAKRSTGISTRRFARTLTFVRKFYQFDNIVQGGRGGVSRRMTREKVVLYGELKIKILEWMILIFENMLFLEKGGM